MSQSNEPIVAPARDIYSYIQNYDAIAVIGEDLKIAKQVIETTASLSFPNILNSSTGTQTISNYILTLFKLYYSNLLTSIRLYETMKLLLEHFGDEIIITPQIIINGQSIDLFIQIGQGRKRRLFAIMLRSKSRSEVQWHPSRAIFIYKRDNRKPGEQKRDWKSLTISARTFSTTESLRRVELLTKQGNPLMAVKNNQNNSIVKAIVFCQGTRLNPNANQDLLVDFGRTKALRIKTDCIFYVLDHDKLIDFLLPPEPKPTLETPLASELKVPHTYASSPQAD